MSGYTPPRGFDVAFDFSTLGYTPPRGYNVVFDFSEFVDVSLDFYTGETMLADENECILGTVLGYTGETLQLELSPWDFNVWSGESLLVDLQIQNTNLEILYYDGSESSFQLLTAPVFPVLNAWEGDETQRGNGNSWFTTRPAQDFTHNYYAGEQMVTTMSATPGMGHDQYDGASLSVELQARSVALFTFDVYEGSEQNASLQISRLLTPNFWEGAESNSILTTQPGTGMVAPAYTGESLEVVLVRYPQFQAPGFTGESLSVDVEFHPTAIIDASMYEGASSDTTLSTETGFGPSLYEGAAFDVTLTSVLPPEFSFNFYTGETLVSALNTSPLFVLLNYIGEEMSVVFTTAPQPDISLNFYDGASGSTTLSAAAQLTLNSAYTGEELSKFVLGNEPNIYAYQGEEMDVDLALEIAIPLFSFSGETMQFSLDIHPSEGLGTFRGYEGSELALSTVWTLKSRTLSVLFRNSWEMKTDFSNSGTSFDLTTDSCCGPRDNSGTWIDIGLADVPSYQYSGDKVIFSVDLSTRARFVVDFREGSTQTLKDYDIYLSFDFASGETSSFETESTLNIRLCKGNFIPNADHVDVEMINLYDENCEADYMYHGETMVLDFLEVNQNFQPSMFTGETMNVVVQAPDLWQFFFYSGETMRVDFNEIPTRPMQEGATMTLAFEEPKWLAFEGSTMTIDKLVTEYDVEFTEVGCLDNEYVPQTPDGDNDWSKYNPVPVELDTYYHELKARCF